MIHCITGFGNFKISDFTIQISKANHVNFNDSEYTAFFDAQKLTFPITVRKWQQGDKFRPLGMKGKKLVSNFLIDEKMPIPEKEKQLVLISNHEIAWLVGKRISENFKVIATNSAVKITFLL